MGYFERFIAEQRLPDLFLLNPAQENGWCGLDRTALVQSVPPAIQVADILVEIEQVLRAVGLPGSVAQLRAQWTQFMDGAGSLEEFNRHLPGLANGLAALPRQRDPATFPKVVITGDFFTRFSPFFMEGVHERYAASGIILKPVDLADLIQYAAYHDVAGTANGWGMKPGYPALAKACLRVFQPDGQQYLRQWINYQAERWYEAATAIFSERPDCSSPGRTTCHPFSRKPPGTSLRPFLEKSYPASAKDWRPPTKAMTGFS